MFLQTGCSTITPYWLVFQPPHWHCFSEFARGGTYCSGSLTVQPCDPVFPGFVLVTSRREDPVQVVFTGYWSTSHFLDTCQCTSRTYIICWCTHSICTACFVVGLPRRAMDLLTNHWQGFLCCHTSSIKQAANRAEAAAVDHCFLLPTEMFDFACGHWKTDWCAPGLPLGVQYLVTVLLLLTGYHFCCLMISVRALKDSKKLSVSSSSVLRYPSVWFHGV